MNDYQKKSYWLEALPEPIKPNSSLEGTHTADVVIIGGGYTGLSTGYHLKKLNPALDVRLFDPVPGIASSKPLSTTSLTVFKRGKRFT
jgi:NADPH-dependent 2,4-dienoyl-CoA reductase/sulfur reductase-like enzyme